MVQIDSIDRQADSGKAKVVQRWEELFDELMARLQASVQEYPYIPEQFKKQEIGKIRGDLHQAESLICSIRNRPKYEDRRQELDRIRQLLSVYTNERPRSRQLDNMLPPNTNNSNPHTSIPIDQADHDEQETTRPFLNTVRATDDRLVETQRLAAEAEQLGYSTLNDLKRQREQLERARRNLYQTDADLDQSNQLMTSMMRRYLYYTI